MMHRFTVTALLLSVSVSWIGASRAAEPANLLLARDGRALLPIVVGPEAAKETREAAAILAQYLQRITEAPFEVISGDGRRGLAVGTVVDLPALAPDKPFSTDGFAADEQYLLRSHAQGLCLVGVSPTAVQHAVWDLLYRLGCRWFFPGDTWEVVPSTRDLRIAVDVRERPAYASRLIWPGYGSYPENKPVLEAWRVRNRAASTFHLVSGHAYDGFLAHNKKEFAAHPEYLGLLKGERKSSKICISNPGLRQLVVRDIEGQIQSHPEMPCFSVEPSDGGGWCECAECKALGSPSDRALTLANEVSALMEAKYPGRYVAFYAYSQHSPPPTIAARPRVIVNCATSFIRGGITVEEMIAGWKAKGVAQFGIREYYSVNTWDRDLPHAARGGDLEYLARTIPQFHAQGARFMSAEASDNWGPNGLGYYIATRILWDVREAGRVQALVDDFLEKSFGPARRPMAEFYTILNGPQRPLMSRSMLGRMYRLLDEAARLASGDAKIRARLDALLLYTRYVELFRTYDNARKTERQSAFEQLIRHAYRMRGTLLVHTLALYRDLDGRDKSVTIPAEAAWNVPEGKNPWKSSTPWNRDERDAIARQGIQSNPVVDVPAIKFDARLAPIKNLPATDLPVLETPSRSRGHQTYYTWFDRAPAKLQLEVTGGLIAHYRDRGNVRLELSALEGHTPQVVDRQATVPPDGKTYPVTLRTDRRGLHKLVIDDGHDLTEIRWPAGQPRTTSLAMDEPSSLSGRKSGYFYVPQGVRKLVVFGSPDALAAIHNSQGKPAFRPKDLDGPDLFEVPVPSGEDGRFWSFRNVPERLVLLNVPPYTARQPSELLLPQGTVVPRK